MIYFFSLNMLDYAKFVVIFAAAASMAVAAVRHREWRGGLALLSSLFLAAAMNELEAPLRPLFPNLTEPELPLIIAFIVLGLVLAAAHRGTTRQGLNAIYHNRRFPLLVAGLCAVSFLPNLASYHRLWDLAAPQTDTSFLRDVVEHGVEAVGYVLLLVWSILFLKDKFKIFEPESKTAIPLEMYFTCFRRHKLTRKACRFLARLRAKYNIRDVTIRQLEEERRHAAAVV